MTKQELLEEFEHRFCNNHQQPIRFLRSIFYDEQDGAEEIEGFISQALDKYAEFVVREYFKKVSNLDIFGYPAITKIEFDEMLNDIIKSAAKDKFNIDI